MKRLFRFLIHSLWLVILILPLAANKGCGKALEEAEQEGPEVSPAGSPEATEPAVLPPGEGTKILESGGPEVISAPVEKPSE